MHIRLIPGSGLSARELAAWSAFQQADASLHHPFLSPQFIQAVAAVHDRVEVGIRELDREPVGFFPFERVARGAAWLVSDLQGMVLRSGVTWNPAALLRGCRLSAWHFDHLVVSQVPFQPYHQKRDAAPYIDMRRGFDHYHQTTAARSRVFADVVRKSRNLARDVGDLRFEMHTTDTAAFASLIEWKRRRLIRSHFFDVFEVEWVVRLLDQLRTTNENGFAGWLSVLYAGDRLVAVHFGLRYHHVVSSWIPTYDERYARYSPGLILHVELVRRAAAENVTHIDLGRGLNQLKTRLSNGSAHLAIGSVELRPIHRVARRAWYRARDVVHASPFRARPMRIYRRVRNWVTRRT